MLAGWRLPSSEDGAPLVFDRIADWLAGAEGIEPPTFGFGDRRSAS